jgi:hypothetical protein
MYESNGFRQRFFLCLTKATIYVDLVASMSYREFMPNVIDVVDKLKRRMIRDAKLIEDSRKELEALRDVAERVGSLEREIDYASIRIRRTVEMIGDKQAKAVLAQTAIGPEFLRAKIQRPEKVSLWAFLQEYLQIVKEARVGDIVTFLQAVGIDYAKRQTIEAVIRRKPEEFRITKRDGQKFVSLYPNWAAQDSAHPREWTAKKKGQQMPPPPSANSETR